MQHLETSTRNPLNVKLKIVILLATLSLSTFLSPTQVQAEENPPTETTPEYTINDLNGTVSIDTEATTNDTNYGFRDYIHMKLTNTENNPTGTKIYLVTIEKQYDSSGNLTDVKKELDITGKSEFLLMDTLHGYQSEAYLKYVNEDLNLEKIGDSFILTKPIDYKSENKDMLTAFRLSLNMEERKLYIENLIPFDKIANTVFGTLKIQSDTLNQPDIIEDNVSLNEIKSKFFNNQNGLQKVALPYVLEPNQHYSITADVVGTGYLDEHLDYTYFEFHTIKPDNIVVTSNNENITNGDVILTATYPNEIVTKLYRINDGDWLTYENDLTVSENASYEFLGVDIYGNTTDIEKYVVNTIDKESPNSPVITTEQKDGNKIVAIQYQESDSQKEYRFENDTEWKTYTNPLVVNTNTTIYARETDSANNVSEISTLTIDLLDNTDDTTTNGQTVTNDVSITIEKGELSLTNSDIKPFDTIRLGENTQTVATDFTAPFILKDLTGSQLGYRVDVSATQFTDGKYTLPKGTLSLTPLSRIERISSGIGDSPVSTLTANQILDDGKITLLSASVGTGMGVFSLTFPSDALIVSVNPTTTKMDGNSATYTSTITWDLVQAP